MFRALLACNTNDTEDNSGSGDDPEEDNSDEDDLDNEVSWINHWVDKPPVTGDWLTWHLVVTHCQAIY